MPAAYKVVPGDCGCNPRSQVNPGAKLGGGGEPPRRRVEGAPMKPTISTKLLFYRIILVYFSEKSVLINVLAPPHWQKQIRSSKNMEMLGPDSPQ